MPICFRWRKGKEKILHFAELPSLAVDEIVVAIGRKPAVEGLGLESAGVRYDLKRGISTDDYLATSNPHIYAAGDVTSP